MIRKTLAATQAATLSVNLPSSSKGGAPTPVGTGFFVSSSGYFVTAAHVISVPNNVVRGDVDQAWLMKEAREGFSLGMCQWPEVVLSDHRTDFALLKVDWNRNKSKDWLSGRNEFPYLTISTRRLEEGEPVYAFGYPLPQSELLVNAPGMTAVSFGLGPRVTSAIVSSTLYRSALVRTAGDVQEYVLDKALNYGNSGGPIIAVETGRVHAFCSCYQPVQVPQRHLREVGKPTPFVEVPSLYGVVRSLANPVILTKLADLDVPLED